MATRTGSAMSNGRPSHCSIQSGQTMTLAKTLQVQDQIIEQLRADQSALRGALEVERSNLRECRINNDKELKILQRENIHMNKTVKQQEMKIEEFEKELAFAKEALATEQRNLKSLEKEHVTTVKELKLKNTKEFDKANKQEMLIDQLKSEIEDLKEALESERNATNLLIREHNAEVKMLREEVRAKSTEAYRELKERATRERDEYREMQEEAEKTYRLLEKDFRNALAAKEEELKKVKADSRTIQKELEEQLRACIKEPASIRSSAAISQPSSSDVDKLRRLKQEINVLKDQNRKLLNEVQLLTTEDKINELKKENELTAAKASRTEITRMLEEIRSKNRTISNLERKLFESKQTLEKIQREHAEEMEKIKNNEASVLKIKPALPIKQVKSIFENNVNRTTHVKDIVRKLQEKSNDKNVKSSPNYIKARNNKKAVTVTLQDEGNGQTNKTIEDLKAIDEDIEKLRKQIEERDKIIIALREAAEAKDKKIENLSLEFSKIQSNAITESSGAISPNQSRVQESNVPNSISTSPSPPLCNGELCWTDGFVNKNYHEPVYAQLLNDHAGLQKVYNDMKEKLELKTKEMERLENETMKKAQENGINLIMAEQIRILKEREAQLMSEAEELREQNDLMEFRILELEECRKEELNESKQRSEKNIWSERDLEDVSDSGVMSLPTSEDLTSDSELSDTIKSFLSTENSCNENAANDFKHKKLLKSTECLQESGIFEDSEESAIKISKSCQTESYLDKTLLEIIENRERKSKSDDLTREISKLTEIQKRIQQNKKVVNENNKKDSPTTVCTCPHSESIIFYEERLGQLEDKIKIYESSGDTKELLLAKRLEKEVYLSHRVEELTEKVVNLEIENQRLDEERCEFEEAENDSRFQCQRLEIKLQELMEKNAELELEIERQNNRRGRRKGTYEGLVERYEQRNFELEEKEIEARQKLNMIETAIPAILAYNFYKICQSERKPPRTQRMIAYEKNDAAVCEKLDELIEDQKKLQLKYEKAELTEKILRKKIEELEEKSEKDRETLESMTKNLKEREESISIGSIQSADLEVFEELKQLVENEVKMKEKIEELEKNEKAYMDTLTQADEIWAGMEADYKNRLEEAEKKTGELRKKIGDLEKIKADLEKSLEKKLEVNKETKMKLTEVLKENKKLKELSKNDSKLREELQKLKEDLAVKDRNSEGLEEKYKEKILRLTQELTIKNKEISCLEVTVAELKEEVETLEYKVSELLETIKNFPSDKSDGRNKITESSVILSPVPESLSINNNNDNNLSSLQKQEMIMKEAKIGATIVNLKPVLILPKKIKIPEKIIRGSSVEKVKSSLSEIEIAKLRLENMKLQRLLEEEEKESQLKDLILEDLRKKVGDLKKEEENLEKSLGILKVELEPISGDEDEFVEAWQTLKTDNSGDMETVSKTISNLQVAALNLQNKCRIKNEMINSLAEEIKEKDKKNFYENLVDQISGRLNDDAHNYEGCNVLKYLKDSSPLKTAKASTSICLDISTLMEKNTVEPLNHSDTVPIKELRVINSNCLFLEWDVSKRESNVKGYEIFINGDLHQKVRSSTRNRALLHPNDVNQRMTISVYTVTNQGRSENCSFINFPNKNC